MQRQRLLSNPHPVAPALVPAPNAPSQAVAIIKAQTGRLLRELKDREFDDLLTGFWNRALVRLNQKSEDAITFNVKLDELRELLRERWGTLREDELATVFRLGSIGDLKGAPTDTVFLSITTVHQWLTRYRETAKPAALAHARPPVEEEPEACALPDHHPAVIAWRVETVRWLVAAARSGALPTTAGGTPKLAYDWLSAWGTFKGFRTLADWARYREEAAQALLAKPLPFDRDRRRHIRALTDALADGTWPEASPLYEELHAARRLRVLREWLAEQAAELSDDALVAWLTDDATAYYPLFIPPTPND